MASRSVESHLVWSVEAVADDLSVGGSAVSGKPEGRFQRGTGDVSVTVSSCDTPF